VTVNPNEGPTAGSHGPTAAPSVPPALGTLLPGDVEGWLTEAQAARLDRCARAVPDGGRIVEIGSFRGRSTIVLARAAPPGAEVVAIDPHLGSDRGPQEIAADPELGEQETRLFRANLERHGVLERVRHVRMLSSAAPLEPGIDVLYVDGAHRFGPARDDLVRWGACVRDGGTMLVHDSFSSIGVTLALLVAVAPSRRWRYAGRDGSLAQFAADGGGGPVSALRQLAQLPWFARNVALKVLTVLGIRRGPWPY
jgi:SAM-dependent methyltransferase